VKDRVATITLNRPERKNPLTVDRYAELRDTFHKLQVRRRRARRGVHRRGGNSLLRRATVHEIIGPLIKMEMDELSTSRA